jgi:hypothetical protein
MMSCLGLIVLKSLLRNTKSSTKNNNIGYLNHQNYKMFSWGETIKFSKTILVLEQ